MAGWFFQIAFLVTVANFTGYSVFIAVLFMASVSTGILPAENMLLYKYSPEKHKGLAFGIKFVLSFGAAPLSLHLISFIQEQTGGFYWLFAGLGALAAFVAVIALMLLMFAISGMVERVLGPVGINVATRLLGMLLAALSVQFVLEGLSAFGFAN